ncbi:nucleoside phosphatase family-domain-containing protein [Kockiozyma suomiensis]|uniref:nucleoside phosphatase family-domain-containing protein n=1 Tax=Kockiozyma suomiensis TaxID=1337062 RepID=UPI003343FFBA
MPSVPTSSQNYGIVIDAGSSGSRVQIYSWPSKFDSSSSAVPKVGKGGDDWYLKVQPGISYYAQRPTHLEMLHLDPLLKHALAIVPKQKQPETPIFLLATAGMRLLTKEQQQHLLTRTCFHIKRTTNFLLPDCDSHIRVIDGETEGLYGWLALNYMLGAIDSPEQFQHGKDHHTFGFLDMGGASAQVAFAPNSTEAQKHMDDLYQIRLRTQAGDPLMYNVFVSTWLGYGANEAHRRYLELLVQNSTKKNSHASLLERATETADVDSDTESEDGEPDLRTTDAILDPCSPRGFSDKAIPQLSGKTLYGTGNLTECLEITYPLLSKDLPCNDDPCLFGGVHAPAIDFDVNHFVGVSEYWHTTRSGLFTDVLPNSADQSLNVEASISDGGAYNYAKFSERLEEFCARDWDSMAKKAKAKNIDLEKLQEMCFKGSWVMNMLHSGFGVPRSSKEIREAEVDAAQKAKQFSDDSFRSIDKINGVELSWTLGKMVLYASSQVPLSPKLAAQMTGSNESAIYEVGYGANNGEFQPERVDVGTTVPDPVIEKDTGDEWGLSVAAISAQGTFGKRRMPGLVLFALIFFLVTYVLVGKARRRRFTFTLTPKRYRRRVMGVANSTAMESGAHLVSSSANMSSIAMREV